MIIPELSFSNFRDLALKLMYLNVCFKSSITQAKFINLVYFSRSQSVIWTSLHYT